MTPSDDFKRDLIQPIEELFEEALDELPPPPSNGGGGRSFFDLPGAWSRPTGAPGDADRAGSRPAPPPGEANAAALAKVQSELDALVGLASVKDQIRRLGDFARTVQRRREFGLPELGGPFHAAFLGNPGTGKTTVARLMGRLLHALGFLRRGHTVEVDKGGLVGGFLGQTPGIVTERVREARGGVLFVDEAYALSQDEADMYGREAISTLVKLMEDRRDDLIVIVAGYPEPMRRFLRSNEGLASRISRQFHFADYTPAQLQQILLRMLAAKSLVATNGFLLRSELGWQRLYSRRVSLEGNGRMVRTAFELCLENQATRLARGEGCGGGAIELGTIEPADWDGIEEKLTEVVDG